MLVVSATAAERHAAADLVAQVGADATTAWLADAVGYAARQAVTTPTSHRLAVLGEWVALLATRATAVTGLVTAAADDHVRRYLTAPPQWLAEQVALTATIVDLDPTPYNVSLLRAWTRLLLTIAEADLLPH